MTYIVGVLLPPFTSCFFVRLGPVSQQLCAHLRRTKTSGIQRAGKMLTTDRWSVNPVFICFLWKIQLYSYSGGSNCICMTCFPIVSFLFSRKNKKNQVQVLWCPIACTLTHTLITRHSIYSTHTRVKSCVIKHSSYLIPKPEIRISEPNAVSI